MVGYVAQPDGADDRTPHLARLHPDGALDTSYGVDGVVTLQPSRGAFAPIQRDGDAVLYLGADSTHWVARIDETGTLDDDFGAGGYASTSLRMSNYVYGARITARDGQIVLASFSDDGTLALRLVRLSATGAVDKTFGSAGTLTVAGQTGGIPDLVLDASGAAYGFSASAGGATAFRITAAGALDEGFGIHGLHTFDSRLRSLRAARVTTDGRLALAGTDTYQHLAHVLLLPNGDLDPSVGDGGLVRDTVAIVMDAPLGMLQQSDGKLLAMAPIFTAEGAAYLSLRVWP